MSGNDKKLRALTLTFLMIASVFAMGVAFTGSAAAIDPNASKIASNPADIDSTNANQTIVLYDDGDLSNLDFDTSGSSNSFNITYKGAGSEIADAGSLSINSVDVFGSDGTHQTEITNTLTVNSVSNEGGDAVVQLTIDSTGSTTVPSGGALRITLGSSSANDGFDYSFSSATTTNVDVAIDDDGAIGSSFNADQTVSDLPLDLPGPIEANDGSSTTTYSSLSDAVDNESTSGATFTVTESISEFNTSSDDLGTSDDVGVISLTDDNTEITGTSGATFTSIGDTNNRIIEVNADGVTISELSISGSNSFYTITSADQAVVHTSDGIAGTQISNVAIDGVDESTSAVIDLDAGGDLDILNNTFAAQTNNNGQAISIDDNSDNLPSGAAIIVKNNTININGDTAIELVDAQDSEASVTIESNDANPIIGSTSGGTAVDLATGGNAIGPDVSITGLNVTDLGQSGFGVIAQNGNNINGELTLSSLKFDNVGTALDDSSNNEINGELTVQDVRINNSQPQAGNPIVSLTTGSVQSSSVDNLTLENADATAHGSATDLISLDFSGIESGTINGVTVDTVSTDTNTDNALDITGAGSSGTTDDLTVTNITVVDAADAEALDVSSSKARFLDIESVTAENVSTVVEIQDSEDDRTTVFANVTNVDANNTGTAVDVSGLGAANDNNIVNIDGVTATNLSSDGIDLSAAQIDEASITDSTIDDSNSGAGDGIAVNDVDTAASLSFTVDILNVTNAGIHIDDGGSVGTVDVTDSVIEGASNGILVDSDGGLGSGAQLNVTNVDFDQLGTDGITITDDNFDGTLRVDQSVFKANAHSGASISLDDVSGGTTPDINATDTQFRNGTAIDADTSGDSVNLNIKNNWWNDPTGPEVTNSNTRFALGASIDANNVNNFNLQPWYDSSALNAFAFGIEGQVTEPDGSTGFAPQDVTISYQGQTSDIDDSTTFTVSASGEYVAVIDEHDGSEFYTASANTQGFAASDAQEDITISGTTFFASQDFTLNDGAALEGFVNNASGEQLQSTGNLQLIDASNDEVLVDGFSTNASGGFTVSLTPDTYDLRVNHPNFDSSNTVEGVELQSGNTTTLATNFTLREDTTADFTATVEFSNGTAIENTDVTFSGSGGVPSSNDASLPVTQTTNSSGIVQFEIPASDTNDAYTITADSANFSNASTGVATAPGDSVSRTFSLEADQQEPSVSVNFTDQTVPNGTEQVTVDSAEFTQADGSAGDYVVVVHTIDEFGAPVGEVSNPIGASGDLTGAEEDITVDLTAADGPIDSITEDVTLRAMLHTTDDNSAFGTRLGSEDAAIDGIEPGDETDDANITVSEDTFVEPAPGTDAESPPQDSDGDGKFEDVNGDNATNFDDVVALAFVLTEKDDLTQQQRDAFDINDDGVVNFDDVVRLAFPGQ